MSANGLAVFDKTLQTTNAWLKDIMHEIGPDRHLAWKVLSIVLQKLRDLLTADLAAHFGAELPLLVRGTYYDQYQPSRLPSERVTMEEFTADVAARLTDMRPTNPEMAIDAVLCMLSRRLPAGQVAKVKHSLPRTLRLHWDATAERERQQHCGQARADAHA